MNNLVVCLFTGAFYVDLIFTTKQRDHSVMCIFYNCFLYGPHLHYSVKEPFSDMCLLLLPFVLTAYSFIRCFYVDRIFATQYRDNSVVSLIIVAFYVDGFYPTQ